MRLLNDERIRALIFIGFIAVIVMLSPAWVMMGVTVIDGEQVVHAEMFRDTVEATLRQLDVEVNGGDRIETHLGTGPDGLVTPTMTVAIERAVTAVIAVDGEQFVHRAPPRPVGQFLAEAGVELGPADKVSPAPDTMVRPDGVIRVTRVRHEEQVRQAEIPYETLQWAEPSWERGRVGLLRAGTPGREERTVRLTYEDDRLVESLVVQRKTVAEPEAEIIGIGTKIVVRSKDTPAGTIHYTDVLDMESTAYYPGPESTGIWADGFTSTGLRAGHGVVAVDPQVIPLGTRLYIPGYGIAVAGDVGGAIRGDIIDLAFDTYREAMHYGRRPVQVYVLADERAGQ